MAFYGKGVLQKSRDGLLRNQWACSKEWHGYITHLNFPKAFEKFGHLTLLKIFKSVMEEKRESLLINNFYFKSWAVKNNFYFKSWAVKIAGQFLQWREVLPQGVSFRAAASSVHPLFINEQ